jgi:diguanylate cyclase (GGDEF)-like protein
MDVTPEQPACPLDEPDCPWLEEVQALRRRVGQLEELIARDPLTGLYNVRHLQEVLPAMLERTRRNHRPLCLIMLDLDHFKQVNDTWGHEVGNLALRQTARILSAQVRIVDTVCRYGGEEFVVILPDTGLRAAVRIAERIRQAIAEAPVEHPGGHFQMTVSMGLEIHRPQDEIDPEGLIEAADKLLYQAKQAGRNRVCHRDIDEVEPDSGVSREERDALLGKP